MVNTAEGIASSETTMQLFYRVRVQKRIHLSLWRARLHLELVEGLGSTMW